MLRNGPKNIADDTVIIIDDDEAEQIQPVRVRREPPRKDFLSPSIASIPHAGITEEDLVDPCPDVHALFQQYNRKHFSNGITHTYVEYSQRMKLCAGTCTFQRTGCRIALSEPLLKLRPISDLKSTLLHEMIHAFLFLTQGAKRDGPDGHGPMFMAHANRINSNERGVYITPYHTFNEEVDLYRVHHWRCDGCGRLIKRSMNRAPAPTDPWWPSHSQKCKGVFVKIAGPEKKKAKTKRAPKFGAIAVDSNSRHKSTAKGVMKTFRIDQMMTKASAKKKGRMDCPVCSVRVDKELLSNHLETCIPPDAFTQVDAATRSSNEEIDIVISNTEDRISPNVSGNKRKEMDTMAIPESTTPRTEQLRRSSGSSTKNPSKRFKTETEVLMESVIDVDALVDIAMHPSEKTFKDLAAAFDFNTFSAEEASKRADATDLQPALESILKEEGPVEWEKRAKAKLSALLGFQDSNEPFSFFSAAKQLKMQQAQLFESIRRDAVVTEEGDMYLSRKAEELLKFPLSSNAAEAPNGNARKKDPVPAKQGTCIVPKPVWQSEKRTTPNLIQPVVSGPTERQEIHNQGDARRERNEISTDRSKCPICDRIVSSFKFDAHVHTCLTESNIPSVLADIEEEEERESVINRGSRNNPKNNTSSINASSLTNCPLCDIQMHRDKLESHVSSCLRSSGLLEDL
ncbi:SprT-like domain-containing protein Spartan [Gracilariopsis chorda]|uniref:Protein with SprT-like domain at the N terminus n=1 Tax=Gracilariopsis chorda TaxID=448386 RepID=A0A2V3IM30_9FLOR|nr:SprT-like domain-containing protein Spartan [Gracilariopsis chorda]|eukprot:PXF43136.1 SprT-like domain-containing protein Spartan [Gracilariopsis chorda]